MKGYIVTAALLIALPIAGFLAGQAYAIHKHKHPTNLEIGPSYYLHGTGAATAYIAAPEGMLVVITPDGKQCRLTRQQIEEAAK